MKKLKNLMLICFLAISVVACKKSEEGKSGTGNGSMSAKINGTSWSASLAVQAVKASGTLSVAGTGGAQIDLRLINYTGPATYQLGGSLTNINSGMYITTVIPPVTYSTGSGLGSGTLVIIKEEGGYIEGTFNFTAKTTAGVSATITDGKFRAKLL